MSYFKALSWRLPRSLWDRSAKLLAICVLLSQLALAEPPPSKDHQPELPTKDGKLPKGEGGLQRPGLDGGPPARMGPCQVRPSSLAEFANGANYDFGGLIEFLTSPTCQANAFNLSRAAVKGGVNFSRLAPFRLDYYAMPLKNEDFDQWEKGAEQLERRIPHLLRQNPLASRELLPLTGQLALLSSEAAKYSLANLIQQNLYAGDTRMELAGKKSNKVAYQIASSISRLGAGEEAIAETFAATVEEMAILSQADSLRRIFRALGAAATADRSLATTFNRSATALSRGIQRGMGILSSDDRSDMMEVVFAAIQAANEGAEVFEPAMIDFNDAINPLLSGQPLTTTRLREEWKEVLQILSESPTQTALAQAVSLSLTPEMIFLAKKERALLFQIARHYSSIGDAVRRNFMIAWTKIRLNYRRKKLSKVRYKFLKRKYLVPWVEGIIESDERNIGYPWLKEVVQSGLVTPKIVETRFPLHVLTLLTRKDKISQAVLEEGGIEPTILSMAENLTILWSLGNVQVPALMEWVEGYEGK